VFLLGAMQVTVAAGAFVTFESSWIQCPLASNFSDEYGGLYGSFDNMIVLPTSPLQSVCPLGVSISQLAFSCTSCDGPTYSLTRGGSDGSPGRVLRPVACRVCPHGGACRDGAVTASPGYWGVVLTSERVDSVAVTRMPASNSSTVEFAMCPSLYCCSSASECTSIASCHGSRMGPLCGRCKPGFTEAFGSTCCVPVSHCARDRRILWPLFAGAAVVAALLRLLSSGVLLPSKTFSTGCLKLFLVFLQVLYPCRL
jgi:hypothetical protein